ncbi:hypothetical protein TNCV_4730801 [Trichonephila clavipes]|nr:hypothetical protein TNCV_4730801 [Trichonephila clavipes]
MTTSIANSVGFQKENCSDPIEFETSYKEKVWGLGGLMEVVWDMSEQPWLPNDFTIRTQEILNEEHQETQQNVSPSLNKEEDERGPMPTSAIKDLLKSGRLPEQWS